MSDWQIVVPWISPKDNLKGFIESLGVIGVPLLLIDNSPDSDTRTMEIPPEIEVQYCPQNLGVAGSWNLGLERDARWTLILSASVRFTKGLMPFIEEATKWTNEYMLFVRGLGFHCFVVGRETVNRIGKFDPNIYPYMFEDRDYMMRFQRHPDLKIGQIPELFEGWATYAGDALAIKSGVIKDQCIPQRELYFNRKWGNLPPNESFELPFGDKPLDWFPPVEPGRPAWYDNDNLEELLK